MPNEVEPPIWKAAVAATKRYFRADGVNGWHSAVAQFYRTGYIMGYRAGLRLGAKRASGPTPAEPR